MRRVLAIVALLTALPALASAVCTPRTGYERCREVTFAAAAGTLTDIPLYVRTSGAVATSLDAYATTGAGVVFDISGSPVKTCRVAYAAGVGQWALGPVTRDTSALVVVMSYDKTGAESDESDCSNTTGPYHDYALVWWAGSTTDWSGNSRTATVTGTLGAGTGPTGPSDVFDGSDYITFANSGAGGEMASADFSVTALAYGDVGTASTTLSYLMDRSGSGSVFSPRCWWGATATTNGSCGMPGTVNRADYGPVAATTWAYITVGSNSLDKFGYRNGSLVQSATRSVAPPTPNGNLTLAATSGGGGGGWAGQIQTLLYRLDLAANSANWQAYEDGMYRTDTVVTIGSETVAAAPSSSPIFYYFRQASRYDPEPSSGDEVAAAATDADARCSGLETSDPLQVSDGAVCLALHLAVEIVN